MSNKYIPIPPFYPFKNWVCNNFPFIEETFDGINNYQLMSKIVGYLNLIKGKTNELGEQVETLQSWFDNLDVQDEIDNKLDEMAQDGTLDEMITQYLQINGVLAFNTVDDLQDATNIIDGSVCRTLGKVTYNDGYGALYKIRPITSGDTVDGENIIALNTSETLIAEKIINANITNILNKLPSLEKNIANKKFIFIGDSYDAGLSDVTKWGQDLATKLGITNYYNFYSLGAGFVATGSGGKTFKNILEDHLTDVTDKNEIDYILVGGGYNDAGYNSSYSALTTAIETFCSYCATNFPNAKVLIACFGYNSNLSSDGISVRTNLYNNVLPAYKRNYMISNQPIYIKNSEYILHNSAYFQADGIHPTQNGINKIVACLYEYFLTNNINISSPLYTDSHITIDNTNIEFSEQLIDEDKISVMITNPIIVFNTNKTFTASNTPFKIGTHDSKLIRGSYKAYCSLKNLDIILITNNGGGNVNELIKADLIFNGDGDLLLLYKELENHSWRTISNITTMIIENMTFGTLPVYYN